MKNQTRLFEKLKADFINEEILWEFSPEWLGRQRFDIYFPKYNIAVEYNGQQHYAPIEKFGGGVKFLSILEHDELKRNKCKDNDCKLFEIKFNYTIDTYKNLIKDIAEIITPETKKEE